MGGKLDIHIHINRIYFIDFLIRLAPLFRKCLSSREWDRMLKVQQNRRVLRALASGRIFPDTICSMPWQSGYKCWPPFLARLSLKVPPFVFFSKLYTFGTSLHQEHNISNSTLSTPPPQTKKIHENIQNGTGAR